MKALRNLFLLLILVSCDSAYALGLWDEGMLEGRVQTEFPQGLGRPEWPLVLNYNQEGKEGCKFDAEQSFSGCPGRAGLPVGNHGMEVWLGTLHWNEACAGNPVRSGDSWLGCTGYRQSNYFSSGGATDRYWMLVANNDPSFDQCNSGPPGVSHPITSPLGEDRGLFQFHVEKYLDMNNHVRRRFHMVLDSTSHDFYCDEIAGYQSSLPFISIGAQLGAGNGKPVGEINRDGGDELQDRLSFRYQVVDHEPHLCLPETAETCWAHYAGSHTGVYFLAEWSGTVRMLFVELFRSGYFATPEYGPNSGKWNWPIEQSVFFPGAEIALLPLGHPLVDSCGLEIQAYRFKYPSQAGHYEANISELYRCAESLALFSDEMPDGEIELQGVHWFSESYGTQGSVWTAVSEGQMRIRADGQMLPGRHGWTKVGPKKRSKFLAKR